MASRAAAELAGRFARGGWRCEEIPASLLAFVGLGEDEYWRLVRQADSPAAVVDAELARHAIWEISKRMGGDRRDAVWVVVEPSGLDFRPLLPTAFPPRALNFGRCGGPDSVEAIVAGTPSAVERLIEAVRAGRNDGPVLAPSGVQRGAEPDGPAADYAPFLAGARSQATGRGEPILPLDLTRGPGAVVDQLLRLSRRHNHLLFDLGTLDFGEHESALDEIANARSEGLFGFLLSCAVDASISKPQVATLRRAGIQRVRLSPGGDRQEGARRLGTCRANHDQIRAVRRLHEAEITVDWDLIFFAGGDEDEPDARSLAAASRALHHLPHPRRARVVTDAEAQPSLGIRTVLEGAAREWRDGHATAVLTYARGPGFVRIRDKRGSAGVSVFVTLTSLQCDVFDLCEEGSSSGEIAAAFPQIPEDRLRSLLKGMVDRGLICELGGGFLCLPVRRKFESPWTTGVQ